MATAETTTKQKAYRNKLITLVHVAKRDMALDEDAYRVILVAQGGGDSLSAMSIDNINKVLAYMKAQGFKLRKSKTDRKQANGHYTGKVRALWLFMHELGVVRDPSEAALTAYVKRIAKVDDMQWMRGSRLSGGQWKDRDYLVIESLKKWAMRFLPAAIKQLKAEAQQRHHSGQMSQSQTEAAAMAFDRQLDEAGFDLHWEVWENLRIALERVYDLLSSNATNAK